MIAALSEPNFYQNFKQKLQGLANKFKQLEFGWINRFQRKKSDAAKSRTKASTKNIIPKGGSVSKNISVTQMNLTKNLGPQMALLSRQTIQNNLTHTPQIITRKKSAVLFGGECLSLTAKNVNTRTEQLGNG